MDNELNLNTDATIPGSSADAPGFDPTDQHRQLRRHLLKFLAVFVVLFAIALGGVLYAKNTSSLTAQTLNNGGYAYTFNFYKAADTVKLEGNAALKHGDKVVVQIQPTDDIYLNICSQIGGAWRGVLTISIEGKERPVCSTNNRTFYTNFEESGQRHLAVLTYTDEQFDLHHVEAILQSIKTVK